MGLKINLTQSNPAVWECALGGSLDTDTAPELESQLAAVWGDSSKSIIFDLTGLEYISSAGIRVIARSTKEMRAKGGSIAVTNLQPQIQKVFDIIRALPDMAVFTSQEEADAYLTEMQRQVVEGE